MRRLIDRLDYIRFAIPWTEKSANEKVSISKDIWQSFGGKLQAFGKIWGFLWIMLPVFLMLSLWQNAKILIYWRNEWRNGWSAETPCIHHICTNLTKIQVKKGTFWEAELNSCCKERREPLMLLRSRALQSTALVRFTVFLHMHVASDGRSAARRRRSRVETKWDGQRRA